MASGSRRSAYSVLHNIIEGFGRFEIRYKTRFYKISRGSSYEIISLTYTAHPLKYIYQNDNDEFMDGYKEVVNELDSMIKSVETRSYPGTQP